MGWYWCKYLFDTGLKIMDSSIHQAQIYHHLILYFFTRKQFYHQLYIIDTMHFQVLSIVDY